MTFNSVHVANSVSPLSHSLSLSLSLSLCLSLSFFLYISVPLSFSFSLSYPLSLFLSYSPVKIELLQKISLDRKYHVFVRYLKYCLVLA